jgi:hypothetical protein
MIRRHSTLLVLALTSGALLAGCGSSNSTSSNSTPAQVITVTQPASTTASTGTTSTSPPTTTTTGTTSTSPTNTATNTPSIPTSIPTTAAGVAEAVAACKSIIQSEPTLSSSLKAKVEGICNKAAHGNLAAARAAGKEVCAEVINASPIPAAAKSEALAACKRG